MNQAQDNWEISPQEVRDMLESGEDFAFLDCRTPEEHAIASVAAARLVPMQDVPQRVNELEEHLDEPVVVMCHHGQRSLQVTAFLKEQGFTDVKSLAGGIDRWAREIDPKVPRY
jgi:adenylyltransferase/sulfurtransferase